MVNFCYVRRSSLSDLVRGVVSSYTVAVSFIPELIYCNRVSEYWLYSLSIDLLAQLVTVGRWVYLLGA